MQLQRRPIMDGNLGFRGRYVRLVHWSVETSRGAVSKNDWCSMILPFCIRHRIAISKLHLFRCDAKLPFTGQTTKQRRNVLATRVPKRDDLVGLEATKLIILEKVCQKFDYSGPASIFATGTEQRSIPKRADFQTISSCTAANNGPMSDFSNPATTLHIRAQSIHPAYLHSMGARIRDRSPAQLQNKQPTNPAGGGIVGHSMPQTSMGCVEVTVRRILIAIWPGQAFNRTLVQQYEKLGTRTYCAECRISSFMSTTRIVPSKTARAATSIV